MTAHESRLYSRLVRSYRWLLLARSNAQKCLRHLDASDTSLMHYLDSGRADGQARETRVRIKALREAVETGSTLSTVFLDLLGPDQPCRGHGRLSGPSRASRGFFTRCFDHISGSSRRPFLTAEQPLQGVESS